MEDQPNRKHEIPRGQRFARLGQRIDSGHVKQLLAVGLTSTVLCATEPTTQPVAAAKMGGCTCDRQTHKEAAKQKESMKTPMKTMCGMMGGKASPSTQPTTNPSAPEEHHH